MCGRFTLTMPDFDELARLLGVSYDARLAARYRRRYNIAPTDAHWIVTPEGDVGRTILPAHWGYGSKKFPLVRGEQAPKQLARAFDGGRCLVPADGFFEWTGEKGARVPHWFHPRQREGVAREGAAPNGLILMAGLYSEGAEGFGFTLLTTQPNATVKPVHDRMPVLIPFANADRWLRGDRAEATALVKPAPDDLLVDTTVSSRVNSSRNDDPECLTPASESESPQQGRLF
jgi:putative SOS response-associated peptidase YedK